MNRERMIKILELMADEVQENSENIIRNHEIDDPTVKLAHSETKIMLPLMKQSFHNSDVQNENIALMYLEMPSLLKKAWMVEFMDKLIDRINTETIKQSLKGKTP